MQIKEDLRRGMPILQVCVQMYRETVAMVAPMRDALELGALYVAEVERWIRVVWEAEERATLSGTRDFRRV